MQIVNGIAPVVLNVPAETGEAHAHVAPGHFHPRDVSINVAQDRLLQHRQVIQVPTRRYILL